MRYKYSSRVCVDVLAVLMHNLIFQINGSILISYFVLKFQLLYALRYWREN
jgi:hypothetical protein